MTLEHGALVLKGYMVNTLVELLSLPLAGRTARARNRFIVLLTGVAKDLEESRQKLLREFGDLKDGELQIGEDNQYILKDKPAFDKAFEELTNSTFGIKCVAESLMDFQTVHQILDTLQTPMTVATTTVYEEIMKAFESWAESQKI